MAYQHRCTRCRHVYVAHSRYASCPRRDCRSSNSTILDDALDIAVGVGIGYVGGEILSSAVGGVGSLLGGLFD